MRVTGAAAVGSLIRVERATWTDERLDDLAEAIRTGFNRVDQGVRDLRQEMHSGDENLRTEMRDGFASLRTEMHDGGNKLRAEMHAGFAGLHRAMFTFGSGIILALIGVIAAILARGA